MAQRCQKAQCDGAAADSGPACLQSHDALLASELSRRRRAEQRAAQYAAAAAPLAAACAALAGRRLSGVSTPAASAPHVGGSGDRDNRALPYLVMPAPGMCTVVIRSETDQQEIGRINLHYRPGQGGVSVGGAGAVGGGGGVGVAAGQPAGAAGRRLGGAVHAAARLRGVQVRRLVRLFRHMRQSCVDEKSMADCVCGGLDHCGTTCDSLTGFRLPGSGPFVHTILRSIPPSLMGVMWGTLAAAVAAENIVNSGRVAATNP